MTQRTDQVASLLREAVQRVLARGLQDPRIRGLITVTSVNCAEDMTSATVYISVLPADRAELTLHGLRAAARHIRHTVGEQLSLRRMPELVFKPDRGAAVSAGVLGAIAEIAREREAREGSAPPDVSPPDPVSQ